MRDWTWGVEALAERLGFDAYDDGYELETFFIEHPELWGNDDASRMWDSAHAYNEDGVEYTDENIDKDAIANKYYGVSRRLRLVTNG